MSRSDDLTKLASTGNRLRPRHPAEPAMTDKNKCKSCRWWGGGQDVLWRQDNGTCLRIHVGSGGRDQKTARLYPVGCDAWLSTPGDFGCSLWEKHQ